jgi:SAM-dependent methyltransferase
VPGYSDDYYRAHQEIARRSARVIIPKLLELVRPGSVIDIGCGLATWVAVFKEYGVDDGYGVDGTSVSPALVEIAPERFMVHDLRTPLHVDRTFDLVVSLEVAEHLPADCATTFIDTLTRLGPMVLFSAAIPYQGGEQHVNEQWPEYWARLFEERGYAVVDCLRRKIWRHPDVAWWYAQNVLLFVEREYLVHQPRLQQEMAFAGAMQLSLVHPQRYLEWVEWGIAITQGEQA